MAIILPYKGVMPQIHPTAFVAPNAVIIGNVTIEEGASVWFGSVIRGDFQPIKIGKYTNIQDNCTVHCMGDVPTIIGDYCVIGHNVIIHASKIGSNTYVGMGSIIQGYARIERNCLIEVGTMVGKRRTIPANSMIAGHPSVIQRSLNKSEIEAIHASAENYHRHAMAYMEALKE